MLILSFIIICQVNCNAQPLTKADSLIEFSKKFIGVKYKYATANPKKGFDCSGFVNYVFTYFNIQVPRSSKLYYDFGKSIKLDSCKAGDVLLFEKPGHVGIVVKNINDSLLFIHASSDKRHGGVKISNFNNFNNYKNRFVKAIRVF
ncbi:MAG: C40 family peptidase [Bacteroidetes bacterium]|nr:C40 family peptidase [Bacteroidota bacterium]